VLGENSPGEKKTVPKVISKLMHRFRTKLLTTNAIKENKKKIRKRRSDDPRNFRRSLSLKMGVDKVDSNMIRMEVINKFKANFKIARMNRIIGKKVSFSFFQQILTKFRTRICTNCKPSQ
jgi:hypothetical protein